MIENAVADTIPYLQEKWHALGDHPLIGETNMVGFMGSLVMTPDKPSRARFAADAGTVGLIGRGHSFGNGLIMRHVGDRMIISPPISITRLEIDKLIDIAFKSLDETLADIKQQGLYK